MGKVEVTVLESATLSEDSELAALEWLVKFILAESVDPDLFSLKSGFGDFMLVTARDSGTSLFPPKLKERKQLESFHAEFKQAVRAVLQGRGRRAHRIELEARDAAAAWMLFYRRGHSKSPDGLKCQFGGSWKLAFLTGVTSLLGRFGGRVKLCPACSRVFVAEHGNQSYDTRECSGRKRQERFRNKSSGMV
jgi:hypothetical protein